MGGVSETETPGVRALQVGGLSLSHLQDELGQDLPSLSEDGSGWAGRQLRWWAEPPTGPSPTSPPSPLSSGADPEVCSGCSCRDLQRFAAAAFGGKSCFAAAS